MIKIDRITDEKAILDFLNTPEIYDRISDDYCPGKMEALPNIAYYGGWLEDTLISLYMVYEGYLHFHVLKPYRKHARILFVLFTGLKPVKVKIPTLYKSAINFGLKLGFAITMVHGDFMKNGKLYKRVEMTNELC